MRLLNSLPFILFFIFFLSEPCQAFFQSEYEIRDLESLDSTTFTSEASSWTSQSIACPKCIFTMPSGTICDSDQKGQMIFGGPEATPGTSYFQKTYAPFTTGGWNKLLFYYEIWAFTTAAWSDAATLSMSQIVSNNIYAGGLWTLISSCSTDFVSSQGSHIKFIYKYSAQAFVGTSSPLNPITFGARKSSLSPAASLDSVGIRNLKIYNYGPLTNFGFDNLPCAAGYRWTGTSCDACYTTCKSCSGPGQNQCTACKSSYFDYGNGVCRTTCTLPFEQIPGTMKCINKCSSGFYWARNQSCIENCEVPLVNSLDGNGAPLCSSPCSDATQFVYPDKSCSSTCDPLLKDESEATLRLCLKPCQTSSEFVYPDGTCVNTCPTPLSEKTEKDIKYCESSCPNTSKYLYEDQSCAPTCDLPLTENTENGISSCSNPCKGSAEYLYPDGSCLDECPTPFSQKIQSNIKFCYSTCSGATKYVNPDKSCSATCDSLLTENTENGIFSCSSPCGNSTEYLYPNGACMNTCSTPLSPKTEKNVKYCYSTCPSTAKYLYEDQSCSSTCDPPLIENKENDIFSCSSPCGNSTEYLYLNGSCLDKCPILFSQKTENGIKFCESPCSDAAQFIYSDKSCSSQCPYPLSSREEIGAKYCFSPCDDFLYRNGSCLRSCNPPFIISQSYNVDQCLFPCEDPSKEYFYEADQVCKPTCPSPYEFKIVDAVKVCSQTSQMTAQEVEETESLVSSMKSQGKVTEAGMKAASVMSSGNPNFAWLAGQASMLFYIRYINLNYTPKLRLVFFLQDASPFDFTVGMKIPEGLKGKLRDRELPEVFERFEIHSNFLYNSWDMLSSFLLILGDHFGVLSRENIYNERYKS